MNVGSLFSGIGGLDHGLARAGFRHAFFCESDPWRRSVLAHHWPRVPIYEDVRRVNGRRVDGHDASSERSAGGTTADIDLLCGGFPCQDVSVAGRRAGLAGARSGLFYEFARVAEALRPRFLLVENVPGLLSSNGGRDFGAVLGALADLRYGLAWRILDSRYFGVPQRRRRVFVLGALASGDPRAAAERAGQVLAVGSRCPRHLAESGEAWQDAPVASLSGLGSGGPDDNDGQANRLTAFYPTGGSKDGFWSHNVSPPMKVGTGVGAPAGIGVAGPTAGTRAQTATPTNVRRLMPVECERLQDLPDNWTAFGPDSRRYAALGDAVTASVAEWIGRRLIEHG